MHTIKLTSQRLVQHGSISFPTVVISVFRNSEKLSRKPDTLKISSWEEKYVTSLDGTSIIFLFCSLLPYIFYIPLNFFTQNFRCYIQTFLLKYIQTLFLKMILFKSMIFKPTQFNPLLFMESHVQQVTSKSNSCLKTICLMRKMISNIVFNKRNFLNTHLPFNGDRFEL